MPPSIPAFVCQVAAECSVDRPSTGVMASCLRSNSIRRRASRSPTGSFVRLDRRIHSPRRFSMRSRRCVSHEKARCAESGLPAVVICGGSGVPK